MYSFMQKDSSRQHLAALLILFCLLLSLPIGALSQSEDITTFDAPGASNGTIPNSINARGLIVGYYRDASSTIHGFVRDGSGTITTFDAPGASQGTAAASINKGGV